MQTCGVISSLPQWGIQAAMNTYTASYMYTAEVVSPE